MKIMGLPNWLHWTAWFIKSFIILFISSLLIVLVYKIKLPNPDYAVFTNSDAFILIIIMTLYICAVITFCFAVSVFFTQGKNNYFNLYSHLIQKMYLFLIIICTPVLSDKNYLLFIYS